MNVYEFMIQLRDQATGGLRQIADSVGVTRNRVRDLDNDFNRLNRTQSVLKTGLGALKGAFLGFVAGVSLLSLTNQVIEARVEYEKFQAVLTNTFQSSNVAQSALNMLTTFAEKTPYALNELTGSFIKLVNRGFLPTYEQLINLGDLASSQGKSFDRLTEAILDAETGEFERLKEFGIKASKAGNMVTFSFKGVTKEVQNNSDALRTAILEYGKMDGVAGSMEAVSKTLGGQIGNLQDKFNKFLVQLGGFSSPIFDSFFAGISKGLDFMLYALPYVANWFSILWQSIKPAVSSILDFINAAFSLGDVGSSMQNFSNLMTGVLVVVDAFAIGLNWLLDVLEPFAPLILTIASAWAVLNAMIAISPIGWIVIGIVALSTVIGIAIKYVSGWADSWTGLKEVFTLVWNKIKADFNYSIEAIKYGFNKMVLYAENTAQQVIGKFVNVGKAIEMALAGDFSGALSKAFEKVETQASKKMAELDSAFQKSSKNYVDFNKSLPNEFNKSVKKIGLKFETEKLKEEFSSIGSKIKDIVKPDTSTKSYLDKTGNTLGTGQGTNKGGQAGKDKGLNTPKDGIVTGGSKQTNIVINIDSVGKEITINVDKTEQGVTDLGVKVREELLRVINSISQTEIV